VQGDVGRLDGVLSRELRGSPARPEVWGLADLAALTLFFWWTIHFLLAGREPWHRVFRAALTTALFWVGLGAFSAVYFSSTITSDDKLYGVVGVVFDLVTWFIAVGAVLVLGAVVGAVWENRRSGSPRRRQAEAYRSRPRHRERTGRRAVVSTCT
jgi:uncharacterized BrkB/YihY/UPF0761 family membrane protein